MISLPDSCIPALGDGILASIIFFWVLLILQVGREMNRVGSNSRAIGTSNNKPINSPPNTYGVTLHGPRVLERAFLCPGMTGKDKSSGYPASTTSSMFHDVLLSPRVGIASCLNPTGTQRHPDQTNSGK